MMSMFTTLLVDDEERALTGIRRTFPWADYGFTVVFATSDPVAALDYLRKRRVDLAFVDIRMPELSGLDIIRIAREENLETEFVIITGHSEFEFARSALRHGVLDYCLKPLRSEAAIAVLERAAVHLQHVRESRLREERAYGSPFDPRTLRERFRNPLPAFCAAVCIRDVRSETAAGQRIPEFVPGAEIVRAKVKNEWVYVVNFRGGDPRELLVASADAWRVGFGAVCSNVDEIPSSIEDAREALTAFLFYPDERVFLRTPVKEAAVERIAADLFDALDSGMIFVVEEFFDRLPSVMTHELLMPWDARLLYDSVVDLLVGSVENGLGGGEVSTPTAFCEQLRAVVMRAICPEAGRAFIAEVGERMRSMLRFVHRHIDSRITLKELSARFHFHPNYGCELFKRYTGLTFSEYVVRMKLWHARHLLMHTDKPIAVVAEEVGYDYYHFNRLFKKKEGMTPKQYRESRAR